MARAPYPGEDIPVMSARSGAYRGYSAKGVSTDNRR